MAKQDRTDRQAVIDSIRNKQNSADKRRGFAIVGVCIAIAVALIGAALIKPVGDWWSLRGYENKDLSEIGAKADACGEITTKKANGEQDHVEPGTPIPYEDAPPAFGQHYNSRTRWTASSTRPRTAPSWARSCTTSSTATRSSGTTRPSRTTTP